MKGRKSELIAEIKLEKAKVLLRRTAKILKYHETSKIHCDLKNDISDFLENRKKESKLEDFGGLDQFNPINELDAFPELDDFGNIKREKTFCEELEEL